MTTIEERRRRCLGRGGTWNSATLSCSIPEPKTEDKTEDKRKIITSNRVPKGNEVFITDKEGNRRIQTKETLEEDKRTAEIQSKRNEAEKTGLLSAQQSIELNKQQEKRQQISEDLANPLISQLTEGIEQPKDLIPKSVAGNIVEGVSDFGAKQAIMTANTLKSGFESLFGLEKGALGRTTEEQFYSTAIPGTNIKPGKTLGFTLTASEAAALGVIGYTAIPAILQSSVGTAITAKVAATSTSVKAAVGAVVGTTLIGGGVGSVTDINRGKISNLKSAIARSGETSSTVLSAFENGADAQYTLTQLQELTDSLDKAEEDLIKAARYNIKFRTSDDYIDVAASARKARSEILERVLAIRTAMATGKKAVNPEGLMIDLTKLAVEND